MNIFPVNLQHPAKEAIEAAVNALRAGEVVMHPTETCYGLAVDIFNEGALKKLYALKQMPLKKPVSIMLTLLEDAQKYAEFNPIAFRLAQKFWPGPLTLVLPRKKTVSAFFNFGHETVGLRCPDSVISQQLIKGYGGPLSTTSANISGLPEVYGLHDYLEQIKERGLQPAVILDGGLLEENPPSTLVGFDLEGPKILRQGSLIAEIKAFLGCLP